MAAAKRGEVGGDIQDLLGLLVGAWVTVLIAVVLIGLHGLVGRSPGDELMGEGGLVVALDLGEVLVAAAGAAAAGEDGTHLLVGLGLIGVVAEPTHFDDCMFAV